MSRTAIAELNKREASWSGLLVPEPKATSHFDENHAFPKRKWTSRVPLAFRYTQSDCATGLPSRGKDDLRVQSKTGLAATQHQELRSIRRPSAGPLNLESQI